MRVCLCVCVCVSVCDCVCVRTRVLVCLLPKPEAPMDLKRRVDQNLGLGWGGTAEEQAVPTALVGSVQLNPQGVNLLPPCSTSGLANETKKHTGSSLEWGAGAWLKGGQVGPWESAEKGWPGVKRKSQQNGEANCPFLLSNTATTPFSS